MTGGWSLHNLGWKAYPKMSEYKPQELNGVLHAVHHLTCVLVTVGCSRGILGPHPPSKAEWRASQSLASQEVSINALPQTDCLYQRDEVRPKDILRNPEGKNCLYSSSDFYVNSLYLRFCQHVLPVRLSAWVSRDPEHPHQTVQQPEHRPAHTDQPQSSADSKLNLIKKEHLNTPKTYSLCVWEG